MTKLEILNVVLAFLGTLVAFGALHRMTPKTECTIIFAFALTAAGLAGQGLGAILEWLGRDAWQPAFDTLIYGGATALMIGTRRQTIWLQPDWMPRLSLLVSSITLVAFLAGLEV